MIQDQPSSVRSVADQAIATSSVLPISAGSNGHNKTLGDSGSTPDPTSRSTTAVEGRASLNIVTKTLDQVERRKAYMRAYQIQWAKNHRNEYMTGKSCVRCGSVDGLEIDHIDPSTKVSHRIWSWSKLRRNEELDKCQVLCHDCHQQKTVVDLMAMRPRFSHGTVARYKNGCRCDLCKLAKSVENAGRNRRRK
jgi:hypothetical protein